MHRMVGQQLERQDKTLQQAAFDLAGLDIQQIQAGMEIEGFALMDILEVQAVQEACWKDSLLEDRSGFGVGDIGDCLHMDLKYYKLQAVSVTTKNILLLSKNCFFFNDASNNNKYLFVLMTYH